MESLIAIIIIILLTAASGFFSGTETAFFSLSAPKIKTYAHSTDPNKQLIADLLNQPRDLLVTVFILNTLVNILLQNVCSDYFGEASGWTLKVGVPLAITLVLGEIIPKNIGMQNNERFAYLTVRPIAFIHQLLKKIRRWTIAVTVPISRLMFFYLKKEKSISAEELEHVLTTSQEHGVLDQNEKKLVLGYLKLLEKTVKELMRPKEDIIYYDIQDPISKLTHFFVEEQCSRVPVCEGDLDQLLGIISGKEYFLSANQIKEPQDLKKYLAKPFYVPETTHARTLFKRFKETGHVLAVVVDEYGSIEGLITLEDLAEMVIGEIFDLRDQQPLYARGAGQDEIIASGKLEIHEFNRLFHMDLQSHRGVITIGGWLIEQMGDIPLPGTTYQTDQFFFQVLSADPNRIKRVYIRKLTKKKC